MLIDNTKILRITTGWRDNDVRINYNRVSKNSTWGSIVTRLDCISTEPFPQVNEPNSISPCLLYIDPKCTISRDSLRLNNFKITRNPQKADYIVIPNTQHFTEECCIYQCGDKILYSWNQKPLSASHIKCLEEKGYIGSKLIYTGTVYGSKHLSTAQLLLHYPDMNFIYDSTLQKFLNTDNIIDFDTMEQIDSLLSSRDNIGLGLKLMSSFNVETNRLPLEILCTIHNDDISRCSEKTQVLIKSMLSNLKYGGWNEVAQICNKYSKHLKDNDPMTETCLQFLKSYFVKEMQNSSSRIINSIQNIGLNVKISIE